MASHTRGAARLALDEATVAAAWQRGMTQPLTSALADAQAMLERVIATHVASAAQTKATGGLTPSELEVEFPTAAATLAVRNNLI